jgi:predicted nucleotidyltransferase
VIPVEAALHAAAGNLAECGAQFALVGGLAVSTWAEPRTTRDVDLAVAVETDAEAEALVHTLRNRGYSLVQAIDHAPTGRLGTARLAGPAGLPVMTDLLFASSGIEDLVVAQALTTTVLPGLPMPVARPGHLVALKLLAQRVERGQDAVDLRELRRVLTADEVATAQQAVALIVDRGFHRDRDLVQSLEDYLSRPPGDPHALI